MDDDAVDAIEVELGFVHPRHRGFRAPCHFSAKDPADLKGARHRVLVHNARRLDPAPTLDTHGFELVTAPTDLDLMDNEVVKTRYYDECRRLLKKVTGCYEVRGGFHEYRNGFGGVTGARGAKPTPNGSGGSYAGGIHSDMCAAVESRFGRIVPDNRHFQSINVWRSVKPGELVQMMPLAICAMGTVDPDDIVFGDGQNTGNVQQYTKVVDQRIIYAPEQTWYYFPNMTYDEVLLFRQYDTRQEALNLRTVFHTAVADPNTPADGPMRYTIEVRMQTVFDVEENREERMARFIGQISDTYRDGSTCDWWSGPIENYVPPQ